MASVVQRINQIKQPYGGYISIRYFECIELENQSVLNIDVENIHPGLMGLAVEYLTKIILGCSPEESFQISLMGAKNLDLNNKVEIHYNYVNKFMNKVIDLSDESITYACRISGYDVCYRAGVKFYIPIENIKPNKKTIENIRIMVNRGVSYFDKFKEDIHFGFTFQGGYTDTVNTGDGDFLTKDTLWDMKTSKYIPNIKHTLQILMYFLMGKKSKFKDGMFKDITYIAIFNPRLNKIYKLNVNSINKDIIKKIEEDVIGYK